ncbi:hypothetical protein ACCO45_008016 [Purpureocillium lilacinum]|uniref:Uncharacterized protein n=1 Tax=Purpureocillium lilacinum TaxID=33203 RepID=A0ACC4DN57_PURLI
MGSTDSNIKDALKAQDIRSTPLFHNVQQHYKNIIDPAIGKISNATDLQLSPHGTHVVFTANVWESIEKSQATRIAEVHLDSGDVRFLSTSSSSHGDAQKPRYSPDGRTVAYTAVNPDTGLSQLCLWDRTAGGDGEGRRLCFRCRASRWNTSDLFGAVKITGKQDGPAWLPKVEGSQAEHPGRALFVFNVEAKEYRRVSPPGLNVWEANWCGSRSFGRPPKRFQAAVPVGSPSGARVAFVQAQCSDRCLVTGDLWTLDVETNATTKHDTDGVDIANATWIDDKTLFVLGIRATQMVAGRLNLKDGRFHEHWAASPGVTTPNYQPDPVSPSPDGSTFPLLLEGWSRIPELILITNGKEKTLFSLNHDGYTYLQSQLGESKLVRWNSSDGLEIEGFIRLPKRGKAPYPLVLHVHGGPVASFRDHWRPNAFDTLLTVNGYAVLSPNPRGSNGRGAEFTSHIFGDMGGKDVDDYLTGIDYLVEQGLVDPKRLGVMGGSYGGYMAAWIITQTDRFAASVAIAPVVDWFSQHTLTNIPTFDQSFMQADPYEIAGPYRTRSPILYAGRYRRLSC